MALIQSAWGKGQLPVYRPQSAGATHTQKFIIDLTNQAFASGDILELALLAPYAHIVDASLVVVGSLGAATVDIGLMSGTPGELLNADDSARTSGTELFAAAALTAGITRITKADSLLIASTEVERSIGVKFSAAVTAGAGKQLGIVLSFAQ